MSNLMFDFEKSMQFVKESEIRDIKKSVLESRDLLLSKAGKGSDFLGWVDLPLNYDKDEFDRIKKAAAKIRSDSDILIVIGIGGSYLGSRAAVEFLKKKVNSKPQIYYAGNNISTEYILGLKELIGDKDFSINVISKSGTTTEPAIAFRIFKKLIEDKYGTFEAAKRIFVTTDKSKGALKELATKEGYETFIVPDDIGGRYSVLTAVGLLPIAASGADIAELMAGAAAARERAVNNTFENNESLQYAALRNILLKKGKNIEILANYEPSIHYIAEWWKQLFGESEGKDGKGIFPASVDLTTDLHSMGQYIQDGMRCIFETVLSIEKIEKHIYIEEEADNLDGLNYLAGKTVDIINKNAMYGTIIAHVEGGVPNLLIRISEKNEYTLGELFYFFEFACAVSGYVLGVNPFDQPGVESYKKNMFALLGKSGYENEREDLLEKL